MSNTIQFVQISVDDLTNLLRQTVAEEVNKVVSIFPRHEKSKDPELLTRTEAMKLLGRSAPYLWRLNKNGVLRSRKMGRSVYYYKEDIFNRLNQNEAA
jgi:predicted DNA-binding transcriptional regulator AlpA